MLQPIKNRWKIHFFDCFWRSTENGRQTGSVQEGNGLGQHKFYNPAWGYQNGKNRNSDVLETFQPAFYGGAWIQTNNKVAGLPLSVMFLAKKNYLLSTVQCSRPKTGLLPVFANYYAANQPEMAVSIAQQYKTIDMHRLTGIGCINWTKGIT